MNLNSNLQVRDHENSAFCAGAGWVLSGEWLGMDIEIDMQVQGATYLKATPSLQYSI